MLSVLSESLKSMWCNVIAEMRRNRYEIYVCNVHDAQFKLNQFQSMIVQIFRCMFFCSHISYGNATGVIVNSKWAKRAVCVLVRNVSINHYYVKRTCAFGRLILSYLLFGRALFSFLERPWSPLLLLLFIVLFHFVHVDCVSKAEIWIYALYCIVFGRTQQKYVCPILAHWNRKYRNNKA